MNESNEAARFKWEVNDDISVLGIPFKDDEYDPKKRTKEEIRKL